MFCFKKLVLMKILTLLAGLDYKAKSNIDQENPSKPGTAMIWKEDLPLTWVGDVVSRKRMISIPVGWKLKRGGWGYILASQSGHCMREAVNMSRMKRSLKRAHISKSIG